MQKMKDLWLREKHILNRYLFEINIHSCSFQLIKCCQLKNENTNSVNIQVNMSEVVELLFFDTFAHENSEVSTI